VVRIFLSGAYGKANERDQNPLTETEHQRLLERCDRLHLAEWLRQLGLGEQTSRKRPVPEVAPELLRQVSGMGNNLNQIARRLNQSDSLTPSERVSLLSVLNSLDRQLGTCWSSTVIVKIHSRGAGSGSGPVDYLLGKDRQREQATVLRGDPDRVCELIDSCDFARSYTSGVLSFQEPDIADSEKSRLMDEWEQTLMTGLDRDQYACLWVEHRDKGRLS
jgi:hypothetical protein